MPAYSIDLETSSLADLTNVGSAVYLAHPSTRVLMAGYHPVGDLALPRLWCEGDPVPYALIGHVANGGAFTGWNVSSFDRVGWQKQLVEKHGFPPTDDDCWQDSMYQAAAANLPRSLDGCAKAVGMPFVADLKDKHRIQRITSQAKTVIPAPVRTILDNPGDYDPKLVDDLRWLAERCVQDVLMEEGVLLRLPPWPAVAPWIAMPAVNRVINDRGVLIDLALINGMDRAGTDETLRYNGEIARLTNGQVDAITKIEGVKSWLLGRGIPLPTKEEKRREEPENLTEEDYDPESEAEKKTSYRLRKNDIANLLATDLPEDVRQVLWIRIEAAKASVRKLRAMRRMANSDGRLRWMFAMMGAQATGRFSSGGPQLHNMIRDAYGKDKENIAIDHGLDPKKDKAKLKGLCNQLLHDAILAGRHGDAVELRAKYEVKRKDLQGRERVEGVLPWISRMMRRTIAAPAGKLLINGDFANIQARVPVWLAGQQETVDAFARGEDLYRIQASPIYGIPPDQLTSEQRQIGKVMRLFLGFGAGTKAFIPACMIYGLSIPYDMAAGAVQIFRATNAPLVTFWDNNMTAAINAVRYPGHEFEVGPTNLIAWFLYGDCLCCRLPSGRLLRYWEPRLVQGYWPDGRAKRTLDLTVLVVKGPIRLRRTLWRGLSMQNVTCAIEADLLCTGLANMHEAGLPVDLHVHDSIAAEVDEDRAADTLPVFEQCMLAQSSVYRGLPIKVDCDASARFG